MVTQNTIRTDFRDFVLCTACAIRNAHHIAYASTRRHNKIPTEPEFVASLCDSITCLQHCWSAVLSPQINIQVCAVFCHNSPKTSWKGIQQFGKKNVELGDIMFCHFHDTGKITKTQAIVLQAKVGKKSSYMVPKNERAQLDLYTRYPRFKYTSPAALKNKTRQILKSRDNPLAYMLINNQSGAYHLAKPQKRLIRHCHSRMELVLPMLLLGRTGRAVNFRNPPAGDDWTQVIDDLLQVVYPLTYRLVAQGKTKHRRGAGKVLSSFACLIDQNGQVGDSQSVRSLFSRIGVEGPLADDAREPLHGMSAIIIRTSEREG